MIYWHRDIKTSARFIRRVYAAISDYREKNIRRHFIFMKHQTFTIYSLMYIIFPSAPYIGFFSHLHPIFQNHAVVFNIFSYFPRVAHTSLQNSENPLYTPSLYSSLVSRGKPQRSTRIRHRSGVKARPRDDNPTSIQPTTGKREKTPLPIRRTKERAIVQEVENSRESGKKLKYSYELPIRAMKASQRLDVYLCVYI